MSAFGTIDLERKTVRFERRLAASPERVWQALVDGDELSAWLEKATIDARPGGTIVVHFEQHDAVCDILAFEPPRLLRFTWHSEETRDSVVTAEISPDGDGSLLVWTHAVLDDGPVESFSYGWHRHLDNLERHCRGEATVPLVERDAELRAVYEKAVRG